MTLVYISLLPLHITFLVLSMLTLDLSKEEFGMMVSFTNSRVMELTVTSSNLLNRF